MREGWMHVVVKHKPTLMYVGYLFALLGIGIIPLSFGSGVPFLGLISIPLLTFTAFIYYQLHDFIRRDKVEVSRFQHWAGALSFVEEVQDYGPPDEMQVWPYMHYGPLWSDLFGGRETKFNEFFEARYSRLITASAYRLSKDYDWFGRPYVYLAGCVGIADSDIRQMKMEDIKKAIVAVIEHDVPADKILLHIKHDVDMQLIKAVDE